MKNLSWEFKLGIVLILISITVYSIKYLVLGDVESTYLYLFNVLGFLPINVLLVTLIVNRLLIMRSRKEKLEKLNMVIGTFYSDIGTKLLAFLSDFDPDIEKIRDQLIVSKEWSDSEFDRMNQDILKYTLKVDIRKMDLKALLELLTQKHNIPVRLLENPYILEHTAFTELLRAVFHLTEELDSRDVLINLPDTDYDHLTDDIQRVYSLLVSHWLNYMKYLKKNYPYLFSLAMRKNPFDEKASVVVK